MIPNLLRLSSISVVCSMTDSDMLLASSPTEYYGHVISQTEDTHFLPHKLGNIISSLASCEVWYRNDSAWSIWIDSRQSCWFLTRGKHRGPVLPELTACLIWSCQILLKNMVKEDEQDINMLSWGYPKTIQSTKSPKKYNPQSSQNTVMRLFATIAIV